MVSCPRVSRTGFALKRQDRELGEPLVAAVTIVSAKADAVVATADEANDGFAVAH